MDESIQLKKLIAEMKILMQKTNLIIAQAEKYINEIERKTR